MDELFKQTEKDLVSFLKRLWNTEELSFIGKLQLSLSQQEEGYGYISELMVNDRQVFYPKPVKKRSVAIRVSITKDLLVGNYYKVKAKVAWLELRKEINNPYLLVWDDQIPLEIAHNYLSPRDFIDRQFIKKGENPEDAGTIARQLKLNELELYTHTKRFIFELLQNADDMPLRDKPVNVEMHLLNNFLLFLHDGKFFDREDVKAICDAAKSTKAKDPSKIGYKGIGFKSVFTDSFRVFIRSGSYSFKFDKKAPIYSDFWKLYESYHQGKSNIDKELFDAEYRGKEKDFTNVDNIPWQIKPIWTNQIDYPNELVETPFSDNHQVAIALEIGENIIRQKDYNGMIRDLLKEPRFLLFLNNTRSFKYVSIDSNSNYNIENISLRKYGDKWNLKSNELQIASYYKLQFEIKINNHDFEKAGLDFHKRKVEGGKIEFFDEDGRKLENIPEKLGKLEKTIISLAAKVDDYGIKTLPKEESILFNYLPTSDQRFGFPFLVNADFVSKTDREFIQIENKWNHYLFFHIGSCSIAWLLELLKKKLKLGIKEFYKYSSTYLSLLPHSLLDEENKELRSINQSFNNGLTKAVSTIAFIVDYNGQIKKCDQIIIDKTGISKVLGGYLFKEICQTEKELPHITLQVDKLETNYLGIETYQPAQLIESLRTTKNKNLFKERIKVLTPGKYHDFMEWLDELSKDEGMSSNLFLALPIIRAKGTVWSINNAINQTDVLVRSIKIGEVDNILKKLAFEITEESIDKYDHIFSKIRETDCYLTSDLLLYERISTNPNFIKLNAKEKTQLLEFISGLENVGKEKYANSLKLLRAQGKEQNLYPLGQLISNEVSNIPAWLKQIVINEQEEEALPDDLVKYLITDNLFEQVFCNEMLLSSILSNIKENDVESFYSYLKTLYDLIEDDDIPAVGNLTWIYSSKHKVFKQSKDFYCPDSLLKLSKEKYGVIREIIESNTESILPHFASLPLISKLRLGCQKDGMDKVLTTTDSLRLNDVKIFIEWQVSSSEKCFLEKFLILKESQDSYTISASDRERQYFSYYEQLNQIIINSNIANQLNLLPEELYQEDLTKIGLLSNDGLINFLLENGLANTPFVNIVATVTDLKIKTKYILLLGRIELTSGIEYNKDTDEHKIFEMVLEIGKVDETIYDKVRSQTFVDSMPLSSKTISDSVYFEITRGDIMKSYQLKLSDILNKYKNESAAVTKILESFKNLNRGDLRSKIFHLKPKKLSEIAVEISNFESPHITPWQLIFLFLYSEKTGNVLKLPRPGFTTYFKNNNPDAGKYISEVQNFLDHILTIDYYEYSRKYSLNGFIPNDYCQEKHYAVPDEFVPDWLTDWYNSEKPEERKSFLFKCGLNGPDSLVVSLRKSIIESSEQLFSKSLTNLENKKLLTNTILWIKSFQNTGDFRISKNLLNRIYAKFSLSKIVLTEIEIPFISEFANGLSVYGFVKYSQQIEYHKKNEGWGDFETEIFTAINNRRGIVIDNATPPTYLAEIKPIIEKVAEVPDVQKLDLGSTDFDDPFYQEWEKKDDYVIMIYNGSNIPRSITYNNIPLKSVAGEKVEKIGKVIYVTADERSSIPYNLSKLLPDNIKSSLYELKEKYRNKKALDSKFQLTDSEIADLNALMKNPLSDNQKSDINLISLIRGLYFLETKGYDVSKARSNFENTYRQYYLGGVGTPDRRTIEVLCRSAKGSILYLSKEAWDFFGRDGYELFVLTGNGHGQHKYFNTQSELANLNQEDSWVLKLDGELKEQSLIDLLHGGANHSASLANNLHIMIRMRTGQYDSIFESIHKKERERQKDNVDFTSGSNKGNW